jgi:transcriptional regulator with XRE-family HTH domain
MDGVKREINAGPAEFAGSNCWPHFNVCLQADKNFLSEESTVEGSTEATTQAVAPPLRRPGTEHHKENMGTRNGRPLNLNSERASTHKPANLQPAHMDPTNLDSTNLDPKNLDPKNLDPKNLDPKNLAPGNLEQMSAPGHSMNGSAAAAEGSESVSPEAAESFIESKRIGERIKYLRQRKQMGLVELGRHTGLSASFLSQLETGRVVPTLRNLARIAMVFSKDLSYFFEPERPELFRIVRAADRQRLPQTGAEEPGYFFESLGHIPADQPIAPYVAEFLPGNQRRPARAHRHEGREFLYMLSGRLQLTHDGMTDTLENGDAVYFDASAVHSYERIGDEPCTAMILTLPEPLRGNHTGSRIPLGKKRP